ncbi:hypothetical protein EMGBS6_17570 [Opitutia bacterium]|nr:hypothetical protein EMGBS6_17570 [Opitutae bacterium]
MPVTMTLIFASASSDLGQGGALGLAHDDEILQCFLEGGPDQNFNFVEIRQHYRRTTAILSEAQQEFAVGRKT